MSLGSCTDLSETIYDTIASEKYEFTEKDRAAMFAPVYSSPVSYTHLDVYKRQPQFNEMTGFTEKDVRDMLEYYSTTCPFNHSVDKLIELIAFLLRNADHQRNA